MMKWYILNSELAPIAELSFAEDAAETGSTGFMNIWTATSTLRRHTPLEGRCRRRLRRIGTALWFLAAHTTDLIIV